jgi:hypothetical protein
MKGAVIDVRRFGAHIYWALHFDQRLMECGLARDGEQALAPGRAALARYGPTFELLRGTLSEFEGEMVTEALLRRVNARVAAVYRILPQLIG